MKIMSFWREKALQTRKKTDAAPCLNDMSARSACRKAESAGNGVLSSGEKNFSVHKTYMNFSRPRKRAPEAALHVLREFLPQNVPDTTQPDDDVYNLGTRRGRVEVDDALSGRSMVEMLGVLAIIGVLSIGAITGYQKAMMKHKLNKQAEQISLLISVVVRYLPQLKLNDGSIDSYHLVPLLKKLHEIPEDMFVSNNENSLQDIFKNNYNIYHHDTGYLGIRTALKDTNLSVQICKNIYMTAKQFHDQITNLQIGTTKIGSPNQITTSYVSGDKFCRSNRLCLKDLTIEDAENLCQVCKNTSTCGLYIIWN